VSRRHRQRLDDIAAAVKAIHGHRDGGDRCDGLIFDAVRVRLVESGEGAAPGALS